MPRISIPWYPFPEAKSITSGKGHLGQPSVEKDIGRRPFLKPYVDLLRVAPATPSDEVFKKSLLLIVFMNLFI
jgi:hypothetical protein